MSDYEDDDDISGPDYEALISVMDKVEAANNEVDGRGGAVKTEPGAEPHGQGQEENRNASGEGVRETTSGPASRTRGAAARKRGGVEKSGDGRSNVAKSTVSETGRGRGKKAAGQKSKRKLDTAESQEDTTADANQPSQSTTDDTTGFSIARPPHPPNKKPRTSKGQRQEPHRTPSPPPSTARPPFPTPSTPLSSTPPDLSPITINRAPVLCLWAAVVAHREGYAWKTALTIGKCVMVRCAQAKGRSVGVIAEKDETTDKRVQDEGRAMRTVWAFGMWITCVDLAADTGGDGGGNEVKAEADEDAKPATLRAVISGKPVDPVDTEWYCRNKFRARWEDALKCFTTLANRCDPERIGVDGYGFYERFRPGVAAGAQGWGKSGELQLRAIVGMEL